MLLSDLTLQNVTTPFHFSLKPGNTAGRITVSRVTASGVYRAAASVESWTETPFTNVREEVDRPALRAAGPAVPPKNTEPE